MKLQDMKMANHYLFLIKNNRDFKSKFPYNFYIHNFKPLFTADKTIAL
jgi:hypothetical protein